VSQETALSLSGLVESPAEELDRVDKEASKIDFKGYSSEFNGQVGKYTDEEEETHTSDSVRSDE
jgi:hypothetical protein